MSARLAVNGLTRRFSARGAPALDGVTLDVSAGEICALLGPSGAGKTTLLRIVAGFERADSGQVMIDDRVVTDAGRVVPPEERGVGFVHQSGALFPHMTVRENVVFGLEGQSRARCDARWHEMAELCDLTRFERRYPHELSGGEQQRVALARALAPAPTLVCFDEPLSNVDPLRRVELGMELRRILKAAGTTTLLVTHDQEEAFALADRLGVLRGGRLLQIGPPEQVYRAPAAPFVASFLGHATFLPGIAGPGGVETEIGTFTPPRSLEPSTVVDVLLRPGDCLLAADAAGPAVVETASFAGEHWVYLVRLDSGRQLRCDIDAVPHEPLGAGDRVRVVPRTRTAVVYADGAVRTPAAQSRALEPNAR
ncbi:MAG TPA: ABC transporter ATP-binding protein [Gemmatimonadaceae bacterium]|nr:ABC transporter ATP-binding protein [Gemmatimonadaceae bacterium]